jgi:hypothetical protein
MTNEEATYAGAVNLFGSDPESPEEATLLRGLRSRAYHDSAVPAVPSSNFDAVLAAVEARGPRCDHCGAWSFVPTHKTLKQTRRRDVTPHRLVYCAPCREVNLRAVELSLGVI